MGFRVVCSELRLQCFSLTLNHTPWTRSLRVERGSELRVVSKGVSGARSSCDLERCSEAQNLGLGVYGLSS